MTPLPDHRLHQSRNALLRNSLMRLFGPLDDATAADIEGRLLWLDLAAGERLIKQGDPSDRLFIIITGRMRVTRTTHARRGEAPAEVVVRELGPGDTVGETGLLANTPRIATVGAVRESMVVALTQTAFAELAQRYPQAGLRLARIIAERLAGITALSTAPRTALTCALVSADPAVPLADCARRLAAALGNPDDVLVLDSARFDEAFGQAGAAQTPPEHPLHPTVAGWFMEQESRYRFIVFVGDGAPTAWTQRVVQQADRVLIVKGATADAALDPIETMLTQHPMLRRELVLLQADDCAQPSDTARWLNPRPDTPHHHMRMGDDGDWRRLARRVSGKAVAVVLSAGGSGAAAHIGALRAISEAGFPIDMIGGTSAGSLVAALYAFERDHERMLASGRQYSNSRNLLDPTLPLTSMMAGAKVVRLLRWYLGETQIEDLWIPCYAVSCNLSRVQQVIHTRGSLWLAVRTSSAVPGIYPPVVLGGDLHVDGALMNYFPADVMRSLYQPERVLGVNLTPPKDALQNYAFGHSLSGWSLFRNRLNPFAKRMRAPSIMDILVRSISARSVESLRETMKLADILIEPNLAQFSSSDWDNFEAQYAVGLQAGRATLAHRDVQADF